jgi:hypothetical protein
MASGEEGQFDPPDTESQQTPESGETVDQSDSDAEAQALESEVTKKVDAKSLEKKEKKGFFKKLFG